MHHHPGARAATSRRAPLQRTLAAQAFIDRGRKNDVATLRYEQKYGDKVRHARPLTSGKGAAL